MNLNKSKIFLALSLAFILGIFYRSFFEIGILSVWILFILAIGMVVVDHKNKKSIVWLCATLFFLLGIWRADFKLEKIDEVEEFQEKIEFVSKVLKEPREKDWYKNVVLEIEEGKRVLVRVDLFDNIKYGDKLKVSCLPEIPENFSDDFDYRMYLAKDNIFYICKEAQIEKVQDEKKGFYSVILNIKNNMESNLEKVIPAPEVELAKGLLFGGDDGLSKDLQEDFSRTGMTHIVAVSGYNVTIIAEYLMVFGIFFGLWRKQSFYFALLGIFIFVAMIGFPSSAIRAGLMGSLLLWAMKNGRLANIENAILLSGAIMLLINPLSLRWDIGFQLSFLATLGIVKMAPIWEKYFLGKFKAFGLMEIVLMTIGAQIFVLPIIFCNFHTFSAVSVLANLLILLIIPLTMLFAFLSALSGFVFYPLSLAFGWAAYGFLHYEIVVVKSLADLKWASVDINNFGIFGFLIWYLTIFVFIYFISRKEKKRYNKVV